MYCQFYQLLEFFKKKNTISPLKAKNIGDMSKNLILCTDFKGFNKICFLFYFIISD